MPDRNAFPRQILALLKSLAKLPQSGYDFILVFLPSQNECNSFHGEAKQKLLPVSKTVPFCCLLHWLWYRCTYLRFWPLICLLNIWSINTWWQHGETGNLGEDTCRGRDLVECKAARGQDLKPQESDEFSSHHIDSSCIQILVVPSPLFLAAGLPSLLSHPGVFVCWDWFYLQIPY